MYLAIGPSAEAVMFLKLPAERRYSARFVLRRWPVLVDGLIWKRLLMLVPPSELPPSLADQLLLPPVPALQ